MSDLKEELLERINYLQVFKTGEFTLASGSKSNFYIDGRLITLDPGGSEIISKIILNNLDGSPYCTLDLSFKGSVKVSISHTENHAVAFAISELNHK